MCCRLIPTVGSTLRARCAKRRRKRVSAKSARPVFEHTELFLRGVGDTTDIVQKEMYTFKDKGDRSITLKPEGTAARRAACWRIISMPTRCPAKCTT